jgi:hypothetical protein
MPNRCVLSKLVWKVSTLAAIAFVGTTVVLGQASVPESSESSFVYVDASKGSDTNAGTQAAPFKTLAKGVSTAFGKAQKGIGTRVTVLPGTYRENITAAGSTTAPVTIQAATSGTVTLSGADVWTGWAQYSANTKIYTHSWPYAWGYCAQLPGPTAQGIVRRQELIAVNGFPLTQVLTLGQMSVSTFFVDEGTKTVYIWPPTGTTISSARVEVAARDSLLTVRGLHNWVFRGLTFQYARGCRNIDAAVFVTQKASDILFDNDKFLWNNSIGLELANVSDVTVQSSEASHNGQDGIFAQYVEHGQWSSVETSYNNWRGAQGAFYAFNVAGMKFGEVHDSTISNLQTLYNESHGLHLDTDIRNITVDSLVSSENLNGGIQLEADPGPVTLSGAKICNNNRMLGTYSGGVNISNSSHITLTGSTIYNNGTSQFMVWGRNGGIAVTNYQTGATSQIYNQYFTFTSNTIEGTGSQEVFADTYLTQDWSKLASTLQSDYNTWWNANNSSPFVVPVPTGHTIKNLSGWRSLTNDDLHSVSSSPGANTAINCQVTPEPVDYQLPVNSISNTVSPGAKSSYKLTVFPLAFTGTVSLRADVSAIPGASASWSAASIQTSGSSTLTISTASSTPTGSYPVTMIANSGNTTHTVTVSLVVN